jgi:hypothetical protein
MRYPKIRSLEHLHKYVTDDIRATHLKDIMHGKRGFAFRELPSHVQHDLQTWSVHVLHYDVKGVVVLVHPEHLAGERAVAQSPLYPNLQKRRVEDPFI